MALYNIPFDSASKFQKKTLNLSGKVFIFEFAYNQRVGTWYFSMSDDKNNLLVQSHPLVLGMNLLEYVSGEKPDGVLALYALGDRFTEPDADNLGTDVLIVYGTVEA